MSFSLTRKTDYALLALARLAGEDQGAGEPVSARQIAQEYDLPLPVLMNVLKDLSKAELICATRGAGGGYVLARSAHLITLAQVIAAIEGPVSVNMCCESSDEHEQCLGCRLTDRCPVTHTMQQLNDMIIGALRDLSIADVMHGKVRFNLTIHRPRAAKTEHNLPQFNTPSASRA